MMNILFSNNFFTDTVASLILLLLVFHLHDTDAAGENINEQIPSSGFTPRNGGFGGDCEEEAKRMDPLMKFLQPNDVANGTYDDLKKNAADPNLCTRPCKPNDAKTCYYKFQVERFVSMGLPCKGCPNPIGDCDRKHCITADGFEKSVTVVNHMMPGPSIQVCEDDTIVVDVKNDMPGASITIHWHGLTQTGTPHMDGVPMITQCPILEHQTFRYTFKPDNPGTFFWHSHSGLQKLDGFEGSLIVRQADNEQSNRNLYDFDLPSHIIFIQDWIHATADEFYQGLKSRTFDLMPSAFLINGRGRSKTFNGSDLSTTPFTVYKIKKDYSYLFHIIGALCLFCPVRVQIENHLMTIVGTDGRDTQPKTVGSVTLAAGERIRVIVNGKKDPRKFYFWIHVTPVGVCEGARGGANVGEAILFYTDAANAPQTIDFQALERRGSLQEAKSRFGNPSVRCTGKRDSDGNIEVCYKDLRADEIAPIGIIDPPEEFKTQIIIGLGDYSYENNIDKAYPPDGTIKMAFNAFGFGPLTNTVNGIAFLMPPAPLLTQYNDVPECLFCTSNNPYPRWRDSIEYCLHIFRARYPSIVEMILLDIEHSDPNSKRENRISHPWHLHGYDQYLIDQGLFETEDFGRELEVLLGKIKNKEIKSPDHPIMKDTWLIPSGGYIIVRIVANNPGFWFMHCHIALHHERGMSAVLHVGTTEDHPPPPQYFPTCQNYLETPDFDIPWDEKQSTTP